CLSSRPRRRTVANGQRTDPHSRPVERLRSEGLSPIQSTICSRHSWAAWAIPPAEAGERREQPVRKCFSFSPNQNVPRSLHRARRVARASDSPLRGIPIRTTRRLGQRTPNVIEARGHALSSQGGFGPPAKPIHVVDGNAWETAGTRGDLPE